MRQVRIGYLGIWDLNRDLVGGLPVHATGPDFQVPIVYLGISSPVGPRWWVDFALQNPSFVQAVQIIMYYRVVPSWMRDFFIHGLGGLPHERYIHDDTSEFK
jgi:hypothetical protein